MKSMQHVLVVSQYEDASSYSILDVCSCPFCEVTSYPVVMAACWYVML